MALKCVHKVKKNSYIFSYLTCNITDLTVQFLFGKIFNWWLLVNICWNKGGFRWIAQHWDFGYVLAKVEIITMLSFGLWSWFSLIDICIIFRPLLFGCYSETVHLRCQHCLTLTLVHLKFSRVKDSLATFLILLWKVCKCWQYIIYIMLLRPSTDIMLVEFVKHPT